MSIESSCFDLNAHFRQACAKKIENKPSSLEKRVKIDFLEIIRNARKDKDKPPKVLDLVKSSVSNFQEQYDAVTAISWMKALKSKDLYELPYENNIFDLVVSHLSLHLCENIEMLFKEVGRTLIPETGEFFLSVWGSETLWEMKEILFMTDEHFYKGVFPRIFSLRTMALLGNHLHNAGCKNLTLHREIYACTYACLGDLFKEITGLGERNVIRARCPFLQTKDFFEYAEKIYREKFGTIRASYEVIFVRGTF